MSSIQERLQMKRVPLDKWSVREQLCLASAVACSGDQNWMSVSRSLKVICGANRPSDWFSQKFCAAQYGKLLENVETPKRKKRTASERDGTVTVETPTETILRKLSQDRLVELKKLMQEGQKQYTRLKEDIALAQSVNDEKKLRDMWEQIDFELKLKEKEQQLQAQWLKEREEKKLELERAWRPNVLLQQNSPNQSPTSNKGSPTLKIKTDDMDIEEPVSKQQGTSPLLTSLLKSPTATQNPATSSIHHTVINTPTNSTRNSAPTITNLLTGNTTPVNTSSTVLSSTSFVNPQQQQLSNEPISTALSDQSGNVTPKIQTPTPSQSAPTLSMLLENKTPTKEIEAKFTPMIPKLENTVPTIEIKEEKPDLPDNTDIADEQMKDDDPTRDEDQHLMEVFKSLIPENIDDLADILTENNEIILSPELLEAESILENVESLIDDQDNDILDEEEARNQKVDNKAIEMETNADEEKSDDSKPVEQIPEQKDVKIEVKEAETKQLVEIIEAKHIETKNDEEKPPQTIGLEKEVNSNIGDVETLPTETSEGKETEKIDEHKVESEKVVSETESKNMDDVLPLDDNKISSEKTEDSTVKIIEIEETEKMSISKETDNNIIEIDDKPSEIDIEIKKELLDNYEKDQEDAISNGPSTTDESLSSSLPIKLEELKEECSEEHESDEEVTEVQDEEMKEMKQNVETTVEKEENKDMDTVNTNEDSETESNSKKEPISAIKIEDMEVSNDEAVNKLEDKPKEEIISTANSPSDVEEIVPETIAKPEQTSNNTTEILPQIIIDRKPSSDDEIYEDAKESIDDATSGTAEQRLEDLKRSAAVDTDDDSPIEVIKEDKIGKTKRDYSRKKPDTDLFKKADDYDDSKSSLSVRMKLKDRERSESPLVTDDDGSESVPRTRRRYSSTPNIDSVPNSPASSEDRDYKVWKKSILMIYNRLSTHKYASVFLRPITEDQFPNYKLTVYRPMDLQTIKRSIENGTIRTTVEFQRDVLLMCQNAIMFNRKDNNIYTMARELMAESITMIENAMEIGKKENEKLQQAATVVTVTATSTTTPGNNVVKGRSRKSQRLPPV